MDGSNFCKYGRQAKFVAKEIKWTVVMDGHELSIGLELSNSIWSRLALTSDDINK